MSSDAQLQQPPPSLPQPDSPRGAEVTSIWKEATSFRLRVLPAAFLLLASALVALFAYCTLFATFADYDDEGYVMLTIKFFNQGFPLYDDVYSQYGPFFYLVNWLIFRPTSLPITTDTIRFVTLSFWLATALISALVTWRLTHSWLLVLLVQLLVGLHLNLADEPGHPHGLCCLLASVVPLLATFPRPRGLHWIGLGAVAGILVMTKANLGVFLLVVLALLLSRRSHLGLAVVVAALVMPALLMRTNIYETQFRTYCLTVTFALVPPILILWSRDASLPTSRAWGAAALGFLGAVTAIGTVVCLHGTRPASLLHGVLFQHVGFDKTFHIFVPFGTDSFVLAAISLVLYQRVDSLRRERPADALRLLSWLKLLLGLSIFVFAWWQQPKWLLRYALPLLWLVLVPDSESARTPERFLPRMLLVLWTIVLSLYAYPVGGVQLVCASFLLMVNGAVCVHDACAELPTLVHVGRRASRSGVMLVAVLAVACLAHAAWLRHQAYAKLVPLDLPGARRLHLPEHTVAVYRRMTADLRQHADTFLTIPGYNSFYFWTEIDPPTHWNATAWMTLFDAERQRQIAEEFSRYPRACVIANPHYVLFWLRDQDIDALPLVVMLERDFVTVDRAGEYEFRVRRPP